jgi:hypothetical protein
MKLTKANLQKIIQEEIENLMSKEEKTPLQKAVEDAKPLPTSPMEAVGDRLPRWLERDPATLAKLQKDYSKDLTDEKGEPLKGIALKKALGIGCLDPYGRSVECDKIKS